MVMSNGVPSLFRHNSLYTLALSIDPFCAMGEPQNDSKKEIKYQLFRQICRSLKWLLTSFTIPGLSGRLKKSKEMRM
jgi:hypothetical protein